jgi:hypothetical protein
MAPQKSGAFSFHQPLQASWSAAGRNRCFRLLSLFQLVEQRAQFAFWFLVLLVHGEAQRFLELESGFGTAAEFEIKFPEENTRHHPIRFLLDAKLVVFDGVEVAVFCDERLREAEPEQLIVRLAFNECSKSVGPPAFAHGS